MKHILLLIALASAAWAQQRSLYQQTEYKGQEIGKLTGQEPAGVYNDRAPDA